MRKLLFLSRVGLLCNVCFLVTWLMRYLPVVVHGWVPSTLLIIGHVLAIVVNTMVVVVYLSVTLWGKSLSAAVPPWLIVGNLLIFIFQIILLIR